MLSLIYCYARENSAVSQSLCGEKKFLIFIPLPAVDCASQSSVWMTILIKLLRESRQIINIPYLYNSNQKLQYNQVQGKHEFHFEGIFLVLIVIFSNKNVED